MTNFYIQNKQNKLLPKLDKQTKRYRKSISQLFILVKLSSNYIKMPRNKKQTEQDSADDESDDSQNQLNVDNSPKVIPIAKLPDKLKCKKIVVNVSDTQYPIVSEIAQELGWIVEEEEGTGQWDIWWTDREVQTNTLYRMNLHQKINHFPGIYVLARKNLLGLHLMSMQKRFPNDYNFFPQTWMLPMQFHLFRQYYELVQQGKSMTYIVKPEAWSQGRGIFLTRNIQDLINGNKYVVQKYLKNPLLLDGLKFDLRIYVLLAGTDPLRLYIYEQGLGRLATKRYQQPTLQNLHQNYIHLTNYSLNKTNPDYIYNKSDKEMDTGHKRSLKSVYDRLAKNGIDIEKLKAQIEQSIIKTVISGLPSIRHQYQYCQPQDYQGNMCFHILGFDVMILDDLKPIVIEVNHTPSFQTGTPLDYLIKKNLIMDTLKLMRINSKKKKALFLKSKELTKKRVQTGKRDILKGEQRKAQLLKYQKIRDQEENQILFHTERNSGYKVIFPFKDQRKNQQFEKFIEAAEQVMKELKNTRKKIISEEKETIKQVSPLPGSNKNAKSQKKGQIQSSSVTKINQNSNKNNQQTKQQSIPKSEILVERDEKQHTGEPSKSNFQIRNNKVMKRQSNTLPNEICRSSSQSTQNNLKNGINPKYQELMNKFVKSKDLQIEEENENEQRILAQSQFLLQKKLNVLEGGRKSKNSSEITMQTKEIILSNLCLEMNPNNSLTRSQICVPTIKGYKHKLIPHNTNQRVVQTENITQPKCKIKKSHHNKDKKTGTYRQADLNYIILSPKPFLIETLYKRNELQNHQKWKNIKNEKNQVEKHGKFLKPKSYNIQQNNLSNQNKKIIHKNQSTTQSITNNKPQSESIYLFNSIPNPFQYLAQYGNPQISNSLISPEKPYQSKNKAFHHQKHPGSTLVGKSQKGSQKNKSNSIFGKIASVNFKDNPLLLKFVQRHKPPGYQ